MRIQDILELAKLGYSANEVKELLAIPTEDPKDSDPENDLNPGESDSGNDQPDEEDPIDAIIERNKKEKEN